MIEVRAMVFQGRKTAQKALDAIDEEGLRTWLDNVAVISRGKHGFIRVNSSWAQDDRDLTVGIGVGALTGALLGAMSGPAGAIATAVGSGALAGGSIGGLLGATMDVALTDPRLDEFAAKLDKDTSALILAADTPTIEEFAGAFQGYDVEVVETKLNEHDVAAITEAVKAARARG